MSFDFFNQNAVQPGAGPELGPNGEESEYAVPYLRSRPSETFSDLGKKTRWVPTTESRASFSRILRPDVARFPPK